jgi:GT2 family glycosyltransferase
MDTIDLPPVTIVISTRNRGEKIVGMIQTILRNDYPDFELRIVDQSEDESTENSLRPFLDNPHLHYIRTLTRGVSSGRNLAISSAQSEFIAITDDDCETSTDWLQELVAAFEVDKRIGIIFGNVLPGPHDRKVGFIPSYVRSEPFLVRHINEKYRIEGISACMGLKRSLWQRLNGFDEMLGAGSFFKASEDFDFTIRALLADYFVYKTPKVKVIHHGFRTYEEGQSLIQGYLYGIGAMFVKHFKCGHWTVIQVLLHLAWRWAFGHPVVDLGHRPSRWLRLKAFLCGFLAGLVNPVDKRTGHFVRPYRGS